jgi:polyphenol oxidase
MPFRQSGPVHYFTFDLLDREGLSHGIFTRQGGVSPHPWDALNVGGTVGDAPSQVAENRRRSFAALDRDPESLYDVWLVHSAEVVCADAPRLPHTQHEKADAILTNRQEVTLFMRFADCVPIFLYDPGRKVVGLVHAGWQGTVKGTVRSAVEKMAARYGTKPDEILAGIGPSIAAHHYPVGPEVADQVKQSFRKDAAGFLIEENGLVKFDLWAANQHLLQSVGVREIEIAGICTACNLDQWYSHRGENGRTGRFGALIAL